MYLCVEPEGNIVVMTGLATATSAAMPSVLRGTSSAGSVSWGSG